MRIDWEGVIKIQGKRYYCAVDYVNLHGPKRSVAVVEDVQVYDELGLRVTELECQLFDRLTDGDILDDICGLNEEAC